MKERRYFDARMLLEMLHREYPEDTLVTGYYAILLLKFKSTKAQGEEILLELTLDSENAFFAFIELAKFKEDEKDNGQAKKYYLSALEFAKDINEKERVLFCLGKFAYFSRDYNECLKYLNQFIDVIELDKLQIKECLEKLDESDENFLGEIERLNDKLENNKNYRMKAMDYLANSYYRTNHLDEAFDAYNEVIKTKGRNRTYSLFYLGKISVERLDYVGAKSYFEMALNEVNNLRNYKLYKSLILELGRVNYFLNDFEEASKYFEKLKSFGGTDMYYALFWLGKTKVKMCKFEEAREYFNQGIAMGDSYSLLELGRLEHILGNIDEARRCFKNLVYSNDGSVRHSNKCYALNELAVLEMNEGNFDDAKEYFYYLQESGNDFDSLLALNSLIFIDIRENKLDSALVKLNTLLQSNVRDTKFGAKNLFHISFYLKYYLGLLTEEDKTNSENNYVCNQILDYNKEIAIAHISSNIDFRMFGNSVSVFYPNIDFKKLFDDVKCRISFGKPNSISLLDKYIVKFDSAIGIFDQVETDLVEVYTLPNTKDIISIVPISSNMVYRSLDINENDNGYSKSLRINN